MNLFGVPALAGPIRLRKCHRLKPGLQTRRGSWLRFTLERGSRLSMNRVFGVHPLGCPKRKDTLKRGHRTALCRFMVPMRVQSWTSRLSMNPPALRATTSHENNGSWYTTTCSYFRGNCRGWSAALTDGPAAAYSRAAAPSVRAALQPRQL